MTNAEQLTERWRHLMACRLALRRKSDCRFAALGFLARERPKEGLIRLSRLTVVVAHDVAVPCRMIPKLRLAGYAARVSRHGVTWGGPDGHRFEKNLSLCPQRGAGGPRLDLQQPEVIDLGLRLARKLSYASRYPGYPWQETLTLPRIWAAFCNDGRIGPEQLRTDGSAAAGEPSNEQLFAVGHKRMAGLLLLPCDWVGHLVGQAVEFFAELPYTSPRKTLRLHGGPQIGLVGHSASTPFDFWSSRFTGRRKAKRITRRTASVRSAVA